MELMTFATIQERNAQILSRFSVFDLREVSAEDFEFAQEKLLKSDTPISIIEKGVSDNCIEWFTVESGANLYNVRRFEHFVFCECESFFYTQKACKHIITFPAFCRTCKRREVDTHGAECSKCEMDNSKYLKIGSNKSPISVGGIRI